MPRARSTVAAELAPSAFAARGMSRAPAAVVSSARRVDASAVMATVERDETRLVSGPVKAEVAA